MQEVSFPSRQTRTHYRHPLRTLTYVTLDDANGGIIRNVNDQGVAVQAVAPLRQQQRVRLRFELRFPRLRVETGGQVTWASPSGQCGIQFVDLPPRTRLQINQWIFSNLLDAINREADQPHSMFGPSVVSIAGEENIRAECAGEWSNGLTLSSAPRPAIRLRQGISRLPDTSARHQHNEESIADDAVDSQAELNWLSRPISARTLAWLVDGLVMTAALLLFTLIFLSITHELPPWPLTVGTASMAAVFVAVAYWSVFVVFGGPSLGARLAEATSSPGDDEKDGSESAGRFR
jgi:hypothetical protein